MRATADARMAWLAAAAVLMMVALAVTSVALGDVRLRRRLALAAWFRPAGERRSAGARPSGGLPARWSWPRPCVLIRVDPATLGARFAAAPVSAAGRFAIWRDTLPVLRDFWLTGSGAGTYETVMLLYQRATPEVRFNQAHNHYLQLAAEGGLLLAIPLLLAAGQYLPECREMIASDSSGMYFVRAGAFCGLAGVAAQSVWETGLTTPANAFLAAVLAAIVVHVPARSDRTGNR